MAKNDTFQDAESSGIQSTTSSSFQDTEKNGCKLVGFSAIIAQSMFIREVCQQNRATCLMCHHAIYLQFRRLQYYAANPANRHYVFTGIPP